MKNLLLIIGMFSPVLMHGQNFKTEFSGGIWAGENKTTKFVGFIGPKLSATFPINKKTKIEVGVIGMPGIVEDANPDRLGLSVGATLTYKHTGWKIKPVVGVATIKTTTWQTLYGIGFLF